MRDTVRPQLRFSAKVQKRSAKVKCKSEIAQSAKTSKSRIILLIVYHTSRRVSREIIRNLHKLAFICVSSSEARWFRVPPPESICGLVINKSHFLLTIIYKVWIIYLYSKGDKSNMENLLLYILVAIFMYAGLSVFFQILWAESPAMTILAVVGGLVMSYLNGDWD